MSKEIANSSAVETGKVALTHLTHLVQLRDEFLAKETRWRHSMAVDCLDSSLYYNEGRTDAYNDIVAHLNRDIRALMLDEMEKPASRPIEDLCGDCGGIGSVEQFMGTGGKPVCGPCHGSGRVKRCA